MQQDPTEVQTVQSSLSELHGPLNPIRSNKTSTLVVGSEIRATIGAKGGRCSASVLSCRNMATGHMLIYPNLKGLAESSSASLDSGVLILSRIRMRHD